MFDRLPTRVSILNRLPFMRVRKGKRKRFARGKGRLASSESICSVYLSCSSVAGDGHGSPSSLYKSFSPCSDDSPTSKPCSWRKSMLAMADAVSSKEQVVHLEPMPKCYQVDQGSEISLIYGGPGDHLVTIHRNLPSCGEGVLRQPIYMFKSAVNWKYATRIMMIDLTKDGVYFVGMSWKLKRSYNCTDGGNFEVKEPYILHCVCKEPQKRFQGRVGPISTFVPHRGLEGKRIAGIWVSLFSDQIYAEFVGQLTPFQPEYRRRLKAVNEKFDQLMFFVANDAACVGIQVLKTKREEKQIKQLKQVYHHERPLILQDGFYLVEGKFATNFLNGTTTKNRQLQLDCTSGTKIVLLGEGSHLIRTQTEPMPLVSTKRATMAAGQSLSGSKQSSLGPSAAKSDVSELSQTCSKTESNHSPLGGSNPAQNDDSGRLCTNVNKIRKVEVCLDCRYERLIALDHSVLKQDFVFKLDSEEQ